MCGIVASLGVQDASLLERLNQSLFHRGPNDAGVHVDPELNVSIAMRRLSILDIGGGHQPMPNADESLWIVYNGEIFNSPQIRRRLEAAGRTFRTQNSDTEVLLQLYEEKGEGMLEELNGMFAFVILDRRNRRVFGARDRFGIKPLYYTKTGSGFTFASELKTLMLLPDLEPVVNRQSVFHYLTLGYVPGTDSILDGIKRVPPAHSFTWNIERGDLIFRRYWTPRLAAKPGISDAEAIDILRDSLGTAIERWTLSDVPVACSLSGGLDSSMIVAIHAKKSGKRLKTYTLGFGEKGTEDLNELPLARRVAELFSTDHHELVLTPDDLVRDLVPMAWHLDEPYGGGLPSWYVFQFMARDVRVGLTGTGGDEIFGDYGKWRGLASWPMRDWYGRWKEEKPAGWTRFLTGSESPIRSRYMPDAYYLSDVEKRRKAFIDPRRLTDTTVLFEDLFRAAPTADVRDAASWVDMQTQLPDEFLHMTDRFSMAHSLEARVPFLDHEFVQSMLDIPSTIRSSPRDLKRLLRLSAKNVLPAEIVEGRKRGFVLPTAKWLRTTLRPLAGALLSPERLRRQGLLNPEYYARLLAEHDGGVDHHKKIWFAVMFQLWHVIFIEQRARSKPAFTITDLAGGA